MRARYRVFTSCIAWLLAGTDGAAISSPPPPLYCIYSPAEPGVPTREPHFQLMSRGRVYFKVVMTIRKYNDAEKVLTRSPFESTPEWVFKLEKAEDGQTRIRLSLNQAYPARLLAKKF